MGNTQLDQLNDEQYEFDDTRVFNIGDDAAIATAEKYNFSIAEVQDAIVIYRLYVKELMRLKNKRKKERDAARKARELELAKQEYPERCFCFKDGYDVEHDVVIEYRKGFSVFSDDYTYPVYRCSRCGKEYWISVAS